jgi:hypothetical protein
MNTVDFSRGDSGFLSSQSSTSRVSSKAEKEAYNAFLVSEGGSDASSSSGNGDFQSYSLSNHFSGDSSEEKSLPSKDPKGMVENKDLSGVDGLSFFNVTLFSGANLISQSQPVVADSNHGMYSSQFNIQEKNSQVIAEKNSAVSSEGKAVLPEGLEPVTPKKTQAIANQLIMGALLKGGTLDADKTTSMYRPITSADLISSKKGFSESTVDVRGVLRSETQQAVTAPGQSDQRQSSEGDNGNKDSRGQQQREHTHILNQSDIQTRIDPASLALAEQQNSSASSSSLKTMEELNPVILEHMDRLLKNQQKQLKVKLELPDGEILSLQLKLDDEGAVHVNFESGSEELLNSLAEGWGALEDAAQKRGVVMAKPQFETSSTVEGALYSVAGNNYSESASLKL